jgi:hypothetical protein
MKAIVPNVRSSSVRITPAMALKHPSYRSPVVHAAAALKNLSEQYSLKQARYRKKTGHA